jgi:hypothetical protein
MELVANGNLNVFVIHPGVSYANPLAHCRIGNIAATVHVYRPRITCGVVKREPQYLDHVVGRSKASTLLLSAYGSTTTVDVTRDTNKRKKMG